MVRVHNQHGAPAGPVATRHKTLTDRRKPSYKVVLEQVTQEKRKLITVVSFQAKPPPGYTFIPAGDPQITNRCKHLARLDGARVFIVSTTKHQHTDTLSHEVHRIGYHFPSSIVERACISLGVDLTRSGHVLHHQHDWAAELSQHRRYSKKRKISAANVSSHPELSQASIDTQAREAIKDLFPKIPQKDLRDIVIRAFEKGKGLVGTADNLTLPRRVQLAVVAHIRHNYTDYDKLLRTQEWLAARALVERACLDKLVQWRGDADDDNQNDMEEILREVIVIPDEDDQDDTTSSVSGAQRYGERDESVEIISSHTVADDMETRQIDYATRDTPTGRLDSPQPDSAGDTRFIGHGQYVFGSQTRRDRIEDDRFGVHRQRAWEEALRRRNNGPTVSNAIDNRLPLEVSTGNDRKGLSQNWNETTSLRIDTAAQPSSSTLRLVQQPRELTLGGGSSSLEGRTANSYQRESARVPERGKHQFAEQVLLPLQEQSRYSARRYEEIPESSRGGVHKVRSAEYGGNVNPVQVSSALKVTEGPRFVRQPGLVSPYNDALCPLPGSSRTPERSYERVLPSIEGSTRAQGLKGSEAPPTEPGMEFRRFHTRAPPTDEIVLESTGNTQYSKRRRVNSIEPLTRHEPIIFPRSGKLPQSVFVPIEQYDGQFDRSHSAVGALRDDGKRRAIVEAPSAFVTRVETIKQPSQRGTAHFNRDEAVRQEDLSHVHDRQRTSYPFRDPALVSTGYMPVPVISDRGRLHPSNTLSTFGQASIPYGASSPYVSLRHGDSVQSRGDTSEHYRDSLRSMPLGREGKVLEPVFRKSSEIRKYPAIEAAETRARPWNAAETDGGPQHQRDIDAPKQDGMRTYLPLTRSRKLSKPMPESAWLSYREAPGSPSSENESRHSRSVKFRSPIQHQQVTLLRHVPDSQGAQLIRSAPYPPETRDLLHSSAVWQDEGRILRLQQRRQTDRGQHNSITPLHLVEDDQGEVYRQIPPGYERQNKRLWDASTGREVIVLE